MVREDQQQSAQSAGWVDSATKHPGTTIATAAAVAYLVGYIQLGIYATTLGVPQSAFGLEFREYVVLALANLLVAVALFAAFLGGRFASDSSGRPVLTVLGLLASWALLSLVILLAPSAAPFGDLVFDNYDLLTLAAIAAAIGGASAPFLRHHAVAPLAIAVAIAAVLAWAVAVVDTRAAAMGVRAGTQETSGTTLDLVIRPLEVVLLDAEVADPAAHRGADVTLVSNRGGQAVYVQDRTVLVTPSTNLVFIVPAVEDKAT